MDGVKKAKKLNATDEVLKYMQTHSGITQMKCIELFGATRLADIIYRLKKRGHSIDKRDVKVKTRYNFTTIVAEYYLVN